MTGRTIAILAASGWLTLAGTSRAAPDEKWPKLDDRQRAQILSLIRLVDSAVAGTTTLADPPQRWETHVLKAAAGMNYIPMTLTLGDSAAAPDQEAIVYLRVVARDSKAGPARSALERWLIEEANNGAPRPAPFRGFVAVNPEEMPVGPAASSRRPVLSAAGGSAAALELYERQAQRRVRSAEEQVREEEQRGKRRPQDDEFVHAFEDFGFVEPGKDGGDLGGDLRRAVAVPPGEYDVYVAMARREMSRTAAPPAPVVYRHNLSVPDFDSRGLTLSSVIVADRIEELDRPYTPEEQTSHPYALGWTQVVPARDDEFTDREGLALVFQVLNPEPDPARKPDITIEYGFYARDPDGERFVGSARQDFNHRTLAPEFSLDAGHQVFSAQPLPLTTFAPGPYRLEVKVTDNVSTRSVTHDLTLDVRASDDSLWLKKVVSELLVPAFHRDQILTPEVIGPVLDDLASRGDMPEELAGAVAHARAGRFANVLGELPASGATLGSTFLRGLALMALSENLEAAAAQFRESLHIASDFMPATLYLGGCFAANGRDREAMAAWQLVVAAESGRPLGHLALADAMLRTQEHDGAIELLTEAAERWPDAPAIGRRLAAAHVLAGRPGEAMSVLERHLARHADDLDGLFLASHLLHQAPTATDAERQRLAQYGRAYVDARGPYQAVVAQWLREQAGQ